MTVQKVPLSIISIYMFDIIKICIYTYIVIYTHIIQKYLNIITPVTRREKVCNR